MSDTILENKIIEAFRKLIEDVDSSVIEQIVSLINQGVITVAIAPMPSRRESPLNPDNFRMTISQCVSVGFTGKEKMEVLEKENAELKEKLDKAVEALRVSVAATEFFCGHADCKTDRWACVCSFCKPNDHSRNMRDARQILREIEG
jgi:hypothetical protein